MIKKTVVLGLLLGTLNIAAKESIISVKKNESTTIFLDSNLSTGYSWAITNQPTKDAPIQIIDFGYKLSDKKLAGSPGKQWWKIYGHCKGTYTLHFALKRSWEKNVAPKEYKKFTIQVQ